MSIELCILASGSAGNSMVVRCPRGVVLIDAGIGPRAAARRLEGTGVGLADIAAICLTHLDGDHFRASWMNTVVRQGIAVFCHTGHAELLTQIVNQVVRRPGEMKAQAFASLVRTFDGAAFSPIEGLQFWPIAFQHDRLGSHGFLLDGFGCRVGYASDLGTVPEVLIERFQDLDVLALEANYDTQMELASARPVHLKRRIMGGWGHLSNQQAYGAIRRVLDNAQSRGRPLPSHIVLLHRSRECNCPDLLRRTFAQDSRIAQRLILAEQHERTGWLRVQPAQRVTGEQLSFAWGVS